MTDHLTVVRARLSEIAKLETALAAEKEELRVTERVLTRLEAKPVKSNGDGATLTHVDLIVSTLKSAPEPWFVTSNALHKAIKQIHGRDIPPGSFRPLLSKLKTDLVIARDGPKVALRERVKGFPEKNQAAGRTAA